MTDTFTVNSETSSGSPVFWSGGGTEWAIEEPLMLASLPVFNNLYTILL